ncbi:efflux RND transporter periplasmic adaptor subunit [Colwellia sp. 12G3]|uniref:efflux RND transporter periplasmic adaptor subunit n=1 Tax=Colwellia sp. 12G3 TaxID=2058299 RepID=UPI000C335EEC|nr:HlyD family efflux transporter periplasmic adaptor subunit [Colwellia sp. 12G3]PKI12808.1 hypothetical protein CXF71_18940 [Colwellia sp. 12G3]
MQTILESQSETKKPLKHYLALLTAVISSVALAGFYSFDNVNNQQAEVSVSDLTIATVKSGDFIVDVRAPGNLIAKNRQWLSARVSAKVIKRVLEPGAIVNPDSIILQLSSPELLQEYKREQIQFKVVNAQLAALKEQQITEQQKKHAEVQVLTVELQQATADAAAKKSLRANNIIPIYQYNEAQLREKKLLLQLEIARFELTQLPRLQASLLNVEQAKVEQQQLQVSLLHEQVDLLNVRAEIAGILQSIAVEEGQEVSQGMELARVADQHSLKAELRVQESQAKDIKIGQIVEIDTRRSKISGVISRIDPAVIGGTVTVDVELPKQLPTEARPDLRVNGTIEVMRLEQVLLLDKPSHWKDTQSAYLYKLSSDSLAVKTKVNIGAISANSIQLLDGIQQGDQVIMSDIAHLQQYSQLIIN